MAKVTFVPGSGTLAAYLSGEIDHHAAQTLRREIDAQVDDRLPELLTLDFSGVTFMDSSGVGLILGRGRPGMPYSFSAGETARQIVFSVRLKSATTRFVISGSSPRSRHSTEA